MADVDLVLMPYASVVDPSIANGTPTVCLKEASIRKAGKTILITDTRLCTAESEISLEGLAFP